MTYEERVAALLDEAAGDVSLEELLEEGAELIDLVDMPASTMNVDVPDDVEPDEDDATFDDPVDDLDVLEEEAVTYELPRRVDLKRSQSWEWNGRRYGRQPTPLEFRVLSLAEIPDTLDAETEALVHELRSLRRQQLTLMLEKLVAKDARPTAPMTDIRPGEVTMPLQADVQRAIRDMQRRVARFGALQVRLELVRQGAPLRVYASAVDQFVYVDALIAGVPQHLTDDSEQSAFDRWADGETDVQVCPFPAVMARLFEDPALVTDDLILKGRTLRVPMAALRATQPFCQVQKVREYVDGAKQEPMPLRGRERSATDPTGGARDLPIVIPGPAGTFVIYDGHHRLTAEKLNGADDALVIVVLYDDAREAFENATVLDRQTASTSRRMAGSMAVTSAQIAGMRLNDVWLAAILEVSARLRRIGLQGGALELAAWTALEPAVGTEVLRVCKAKANEAFALGRHAEIRTLVKPTMPIVTLAAQPEVAIDYVVQSAVLDQATCPNCEAVDGEVMEFGSDRQLELEPPYANCEGKDNCRCVQLFILADRREDFDAQEGAPEDTARREPPRDRPVVRDDMADYNEALSSARETEAGTDAREDALRRLRTVGKRLRKKGWGSVVDALEEGLDS